MSTTGELVIRQYAPSPRVQQASARQNEGWQVGAGALIGLAGATAIGIGGVVVVAAGVGNAIADAAVGVGSAIAHAAVATGQAARERIDQRIAANAQAYAHYAAERAKAAAELLRHAARQRQAPTIAIALPQMPRVARPTQPFIIDAGQPPQVSASQDERLVNDLEQADDADRQQRADDLLGDWTLILIGALPDPAERERLGTMLQQQGVAAAAAELDRLRQAQRQTELGRLQQEVRELHELVRRAHELVDALPDRHVPGSLSQQLADQAGGIRATFERLLSSSDHGLLSRLVAQYRAQIDDVAANATGARLRAHAGLIAPVWGEVYLLEGLAADAGQLGVAQDTVAAAAASRQQLLHELERAQRDADALRITFAGLHERLADIAQRAGTARAALRQAIDRQSQQRIAELAAAALAEVRTHQNAPLGPVRQSQLADGGIRLVAGTDARGLEVIVSPSVGLSYHTFGFADISCIPVIEGFVDGLHRRHVVVSEPIGGLNPQALATVTLIQTLMTMGYQRDEIMVTMQGATAVIEAAKPGVPQFRSHVSAAGERQDGGLTAPELASIWDRDAQSQQEVQAHMANRTSKRREEAERQRVSE